MAKPTIYAANALTGGADGALDSIDGAILNDGDIAIAIIDGSAYTYRLDADRAEGEDSPDIIVPDDNADDKGWVQKVVSKEYIDLTSGGQLDFFLSDTADGVLGDYDMAYGKETGDGESTEVSGALGEADDQLLKGYITEVGKPNLTLIPAGVAGIHIHAKKGASNHKATRIYATLVRREADTSETVIATSGTSEELTDSERHFYLRAPISVDVEMLAADRLVCKVYANVGGGAVDAVVTLYMEGTTDSYFSTPVTSAVWIQDYDDISNNDGATDVTGAELEELSDGSETTLHSHLSEAEIFAVIDGGGSAIETGIKGDIEVPFDCTITSVTMLADQSGSIVVDIWKQAYADFPPEDAQTITSVTPPTITTAVKSQDSTLTDWTTSLTKGDTLRFNVDSITTIERVTLSLKVNKV